MRQTRQRLTIVITPSRWLALFVLCSHLAAMAVVAGVALYNSNLALLLLLPLTASLYRSWVFRVSLTNDSSIHRLEWCPDDEWVLTEAGGKSLPARLLKRSFVSPWMTILSFSVGGLLPRHVLLLPDNSDPDQVRRLRVRLRLGHGAR